MTSSSIHIDIPPRYCPLPSALHPSVASLQSRGAQWLNGYGLCTEDRQRARMLGNDCGGFYGRIIPDANIDRLQLAVDWCFLGFVLDDVMCDEGSPSASIGPFADLAAKSLRVLEVPTAEVGDAKDVFIPPARDIARRTKAMATPTQVRRAVDAHRAWYFGVLWEFGFRSTKTYPAIDDYAYMRQHAAGGLSTICWLEIIDGAEIPESEMSSPQVRAVSELALTTAALDDDLFSYGKEQWIARADPAKTDPNLNMVDILVTVHGYTVDAALLYVTELCNRLTLRFIQLRDRIQVKASAPLNDYLRHLSHLLRGNIEWGLRAARYSDPDGRSPAAVSTSITWTETPPADSDPPPIPSISWWWDHSL